MVMSWLACPMPPSIRQSIMWIDSASEIWRDLCDLFSHGDKFRIADLQEELQNFRQGDLTVSQYYTRLRILWKELFMYRTIMACSYSTTCSCGILSKIQKERDDDCVIKFLRGLNDEFSQVRSQVMLMEPMPGLTRTFSLVLQQECEFGGQLPQVPQESSALAAINDNSTCNNYSSRGGFSNNRGDGRSGKGNSTGVHQILHQMQKDQPHHRHVLPNLWLSTWI
uniref:Retrotransposon gag domain-containing protein n=1 Tax=Cajanus cajan TaxID=3821 RepID=A0A151SLW0_CAJCA|nr:hypothetical protein KK1_002069 [Cajanus cajan]